MTNPKEITRFLTPKLTEFLNMPHSQRSEKYGSGIYKMYQRVVENTRQSFIDQRFVLSRLIGDKETKKYMEKAEHAGDSLTYYQMLYDDFKNIEATENTKSLLDNTIRYVYLAMNELEKFGLKELSNEDFEKVVSWLTYAKTNLKIE